MNIALLEGRVIWRQLCFIPHCLQTDWEIQSRNVSFEDGHRPGRPISPLTRKLCFLWEKGNHTEEDPYVIIPELKDRCAASIGTAKSNVCDDLNLRKTAAR